MIIKKISRKVKAKIRGFLGIHFPMSGEEYVTYLRNLGVRIGERVVF